MAGYPNGTDGGGKAMTRYEAAALLNACLDRVTEVTDELKTLIKEFEKELAVLKGRVDGLEARVGVLEANQFSTTTRLTGIATFVLGGNSFGGDAAAVAAAQSVAGATTFNYDVRLTLDTSFTGKDLLRTTLRAGNFANSSFGAIPLNALEVGFQENCGEGVDCGDVVAINRLFYQVPIGSGFTATVGARVRQDDMLAMWPSVYPGDSVLNIFTGAGAPAAYSLNLGAGAGLTYTDPSGFNVSLNYVSANADNGNPTVYALGSGGLLTEAAAETITGQIGYAARQWGAAFVYTFAQNSGFAGTPFSQALLTRNPKQSVDTQSAISTHSIGLSAYWQPSTTGWIPSISAGWGYTTYSYGPGSTIVTTNINPPINAPITVPIDQTAVAQSWFVGLQWDDALVKGNSAGFAFGQPTFGTADAHTGHALNDGNYAFEWWYKIQVTDHISVTPAIFYLSNPSGQRANVNGIGTTGNEGTAGVFNDFGALIKTTFRF